MLHGLGGIGKSKLASVYAQSKHAQNKYQLIAWISGSHLQKSYSDIIQLLGLHTECVSYPGFINLYLQSIGKCLFVFDDIDKTNDIKTYLPHTGDILITARHNEFPYTCYQLDALAKDNSVDLLKKIIKNYDNKREITKDNEKQLSDLAKILSGIPLCLKLAATYIGKNKISIIDYKNQYHKKINMLIERKSLDDYQQTVLSTTLLSLEKASQTHPLVKTILQYFCYLNENDIPVYFLEYFLTDFTKENIPQLSDTLVEILNSYAFTTSVHDINKERFFSLHPFLLELIRFNFNSDASRKTYHMLKKLNSACSVDNQYSNFKKIALFPHFSNLLKNLQSIKIDYKNFHAPKLVKEVNQVGLLQQYFLNYEFAKNCFNYALGLLEKSDNQNEILYRTSLLNNYGLVLTQFRQYDSALYYLQQCL